MKLAPYEYVHVRDANTNITRIEVGPQNFTSQEGEEVLHGSPQKFIILKPYTFAIIQNPVIMEKNGMPKMDKHKCICLRLGKQEIRTDKQYQDPFPLYPGEVLKKIENLTIIPRDYALKVRANCSFVNAQGKKVEAGDEWLIKGPTIYMPRIEEDKMQLILPVVIECNKALKLRAKYDCVDRKGVKHSAGEEWLVRETGHYLPDINEVQVEIVNGTILTNRKALQLTALKTFHDVYGVLRRAGEEWLVTKAMSSIHICDIHEKIVCEVPLTVIQQNEHCYLLNPLENGKNNMTKKVLIVGPTHFFLQPGEQLVGGVKKNYILSDDEALLLKATEAIKNKKEGDKRPGDCWMVYGPRNYVPPVEVEIVERRKAIPLDSIEGIYVREFETGQVRAVVGKTYMLKANEELFTKEVPSLVTTLLKKQTHSKNQLPYSVITFKVPYDSVTQIYDYKIKKSRVAFGPTLVMLNPDEQFTVNVISGGVPKRPGVIKTLYIKLGPYFSTDKIKEVETSDHARLKLQLGYKWSFKADNPEVDGHKIFNVRDFVGDLCSMMASRIRAIIATMPFDAFHKSYARTIRRAIFGVNPETGVLNSEYLIEANNLLVYDVDIKSVTPMDKSTKKSLQKTTTQAIEITSKVQEQEARRQAEKIEQEEKAKLERQILESKTKVEEARKKLLELKADSDSVKSKGQAIAEARAKAEAAEIASKADVTFAELKAMANTIHKKEEIAHLILKNEIALNHKKAMNALKVAKSRELAVVESNKFDKIMKSLGPETLVEIANAGPESQSKMLSSLGLQGYMLMDSKNPINLFTSAAGMIEPPNKP